jgi:integrase/recombinase XerD
MNKICSHPHLRKVVEAYEHHLQHVAGLAEGTCAQRLRQAEDFLKDLYAAAPVEWSRLSGSAVLGYVLQAQTLGQGMGLPALASGLRSLLRFLRLSGYIGLDLEAAVPRVAHVPSAPPPPSLSEKHLQAVLAAAERRSGVGKRDYAILLCLARLGLRPGEVARLSLADLDWERATVRLRKTKGGREHLLPLSQAVGQAVVAYLRHGRPLTQVDCVFVSCHPVPVALKAAHISQIVRRALSRVPGVGPVRGANLLRHTFATHLVQNGASLKTVADLLRHRQLDTTRVYAQVNLPMLASLALPWPEVAQ